MIILTKPELSLSTNFVKSKQKKNDEGMKIMNRILSVVLLEKTAQAK